MIEMKRKMYIHPQISNPVLPVCRLVSLWKIRPLYPKPKYIYIPN